MCTGRRSSGSAFRSASSRRCWPPYACASCCAAERYHRLDFLGAALIVAATVRFMLALNMGETVHPWTSAPILLALAAAAILAVAFVAPAAHRARAADSLAILKDPVARSAIAFNTLRLERDHRPQYLPADVSGSVIGAVRGILRPQPDDPDGDAQRQRRAGRLR